jgi:hypothetical protein
MDDNRRCDGVGDGNETGKREKFEIETRKS